MEHEVGVSPVELAQSCRLALAKQLLHDRSMKLVDVAYASGFTSVRRFNAAFRERFRRTPSSLMRAHTNERDSLTFTIGFRQPFASRPLLEFLAARAIPGVEAVSLATLSYRRTLSALGRSGWMQAQIDEQRSVVTVEVSASLSRSLMAIARRTRALLDLDADPAAIDAHLALDSKLSKLVRTTPGIRVPGTLDPFELVVRAVLGQQVSVRAATTLAGRFAKTFGESLVTPFDDLTVVFPHAERVASLAIQTLRKIGLTNARARTIHEVAKAAARGALDLDAANDPRQASATLLALRGIGPWTVEYVGMRALRSPDAFPASDLVLRQNANLSERELGERSKRWSPWRAYAAMHLWLKGKTQ